MLAMIDIPHVNHKIQNSFAEGHIAVEPRNEATVSITASPLKKRNKFVPTYQAIILNSFPFSKERHEWVSRIAIQSVAFASDPTQTSSSACQNLTTVEGESFSGLEIKHGDTGILGIDFSNTSNWALRHLPISALSALGTFDVDMLVLVPPDGNWPSCSVGDLVQSNFGKSDFKISCASGHHWDNNQPGWHFWWTDSRVRSVSLLRNKLVSSVVSLKVRLSLHVRSITLPESTGTAQPVRAILLAIKGRACATVCRVCLRR